MNIEMLLTIDVLGINYFVAYISIFDQSPLNRTGTSPSAASGALLVNLITIAVGCLGTYHW